MNNALEDIVEVYLRRIEKCRLVERNVFMAEGELDAIGIDPEKKRVILCEATASTDAYGPKCVEKLKGKFLRAEAYVKANLSWLGFPAIEGQFWAPYITKEQRTAVSQCPELKLVKVIDGHEYFQRRAKLREALRGVDPKTLNPTCQLICLDQALKKKISDRNAHAKGVRNLSNKTSAP